MAFTIDTTELDKVLIDFLSPFGVEKVQMGLDFSYFLESETVQYSLLVSEEADETFTNYVNTLFPEIKNVDIFIWSVLHELGHHMTVDEFDDEDWDEYVCRTSVGRIDDYEYYALPIETAATVWAGEYIQSHMDEVTKLWNDSLAAIKNIYSTLKSNF